MNTKYYCWSIVLKILDSIKNKVLIPFRLVPAEGLTPEKIAFSITIGVISGIFPVFGATTILSLLLTLLFRQNLFVVQSVQWIMALFQVLLIVPFMQFGAFLLNQQSLHISIEHIKLAFQPSMVAGLKALGVLHLYGILSWSIVVLPLGIVSYLLFLTIFKKKTWAIGHCAYHIWIVCQMVSLFPKNILPTQNAYKACWS